MRIAELYARIIELSEAQTPFAVTTITEATGSIPRGVGAEMVVLGDGSTIDTIGSRRKVQTVFSQLKEEGISPALLDAVHSPIGLDLGGRSPAEIAVSIVAEIIAKDYGKLRSGLEPMTTQGASADAT